jgi:IS5 family transposase
LGTGSRAAGRRARQIGFKLPSRSAAGRDEASAVVRRVTGESADLAQTAVRDAERLMVNAKRALRGARAKAEVERTNGESNPAAGRRRGRLARAVDDLTDPD